MLAIVFLFSSEPEGSLEESDNLYMPTDSYPISICLSSLVVLTLIAHVDHANIGNSTKICKVLFFCDVINNPLSWDVQSAAD